MVKFVSENDRNISKDLIDRVFSLAREIFGGLNFERAVNHPSFSVYNGKVIAEILSPDSGLIIVKNQLYLDNAKKFAEKLESEIFKKDGEVILKEQYSSVYYEVPMMGVYTY